MKKVIELIEKKLPWGIIGGIVGVIGLCVTIYLTFYYEKNTEVTFQVVNESDILDVRKPLKELEVFFEGEEIQKDNLNLKVIRFSIVNTGQVDILQNFFDEKEKWGFKISDGKIIEIRTVGNNSKYLRDNIAPTQINDKFIELEKIIFEKEKSITFEILVLHNKNSPPDIIPVGKIAGIDDFKITNIASEKNEKSLAKDLFNGELYIHLLRTLLYGIVFMTIIIISVVIYVFISDFKDKILIKKRKEKLEKVFSAHILENKDYKMIFQAYINNKISLIYKLKSILESNSEIGKYVEKALLDRKYYPDWIKQHSMSNSFEYMMEKDSVISIEEINTIIYKLVESRKIINIEDKYVLDTELQFVIDNLMDLIK